MERTMKDKCVICESDLNEFTRSTSHINKCRYCYSDYKKNRNKLSHESKKIKARQKAKLLVRAGIIVREPCKLCGSTNSENHHPDYNNPTDVTFLCNKCHNELHVLERRALCV